LFSGCLDTDLDGNRGQVFSRPRIVRRRACSKDAATGGCRVHFQAALLASRARTARGKLLIDLSVINVFLPVGLIATSNPRLINL